jgi:tetratricopeptide (TPR) repeat protein
MKKLILTCLVAAVSLGLNAQDLPKPSPKGEIEQIVGLTELEIEYSRPSAKGRKIFGDLVPFGETWRFGANASTQFSTSDDLTIGGKKLTAGDYSLFALPMEDGNWDIIFNTDLEGGISEYSKEKDALRITVKAKENSFTETFTLNFDDITVTSASIVMLWENLRVSVPFEVNTNAIAQKNIEEAIKKGKDLDKVYNAAAGYYFNSLGENEKALKMIEESIAIKADFQNQFTKARILAAMGKTMDAIALGKKALTLAEAAEAKGWITFINSSLETWSKSLK